MTEDTPLTTYELKQRAKQIAEHNANAEHNATVELAQWCETECCTGSTGGTLYWWDAAGQKRFD